jgi:hypothetical protein
MNFLDKFRFWDNLEWEPKKKKKNDLSSNELLDSKKLWQEWVDETINWSKQKLSDLKLDLNLEKPKENWKSDKSETEIKVEQVQLEDIETKKQELVFTKIINFVSKSLPQYWENLTSLSSFSVEEKNILSESIRKIDWRDEVVNDIMIDAWKDEIAKKSLENNINNPALWEFVVMFLWLNPDNPINDLDNQVKGRKILESFKSVWIRKDEKWIQVTDWEIPFKWIDFSQLQYKDVKESINKILNLKKSTETDADFIKAIFTTWIDKEIDWNPEKVDKKTIKLEIKPPKSSDWKITNSEFNEVITEGLQE